LIISLAACGLAMSACGKDSEPAEPDATTTTGQARTTATTPIVTPRSTKDGCSPAAEAEPRAESRTSPKRRSSRRLRYVATLRTNCGTIQIKLDAGHFPRTVRSFTALARSGFYDGLSFYRIAKPGGNDFVIQAGDPLGTGEGGPGYSVVESPPRSQVYPVGTVAMAKADDEKRGTSGSQFFIVTGPDAVLDPVYAVLGRVVEGRRIVRRIAAVPTDPVTEMPIDPVVIKRVTVRSSPP